MEHLVKVYFPGPYSEADYIIGNGALACVFNERLYYEEDQEKRLELDKYKTVCDTNMEKALSGLRVQTSASFENIKALTFGVCPGCEFIEDMVALLVKLTESLGNACFVHSQTRYPVDTDVPRTKHVPDPRLSSPPHT